MFSFNFYLLFFLNIVGGKNQIANPILSRIESNRIVNWIGWIYLYWISHWGLKSWSCEPCLGKIIISGQSVIQLDSEPRNISSPRAVLLDQLSPESPPCSLCTVTGWYVLKSHILTILSRFLHWFCLDSCSCMMVFLVLSSRPSSGSVWFVVLHLVKLCVTFF